MNKTDAIAKRAKPDSLPGRVHGDLPSHVHVTESGEQWLCNSPYCISKVREHPDNGGVEPVVIGHEPWKR